MEGDKALKLVQSKLNDRQRQFCWEFVHGEHQGNATQSYLSVYRDSSVRSAGTSAAQLLADPRIAKVIGELRREKAEKRISDMRPWEELVGEAQMAD